MKTKVAVIGSVGIPANYGGFETCVEQLCRNLLTGEENSNLDVTVYCSGKSYKQQVSSLYGAKLVYIPFLSPNGWQSLFYDAASIMHAYQIQKCDKLLLLGVSGVWILPLIKHFKKNFIITNLDGIEWKRQKWKKSARFVLKNLERIAVKYSDKIISDNEGIQQYLRENFNTESHFIPYGGDHFDIEFTRKDEILEKYGVLENGYSINISRIEPENNNHLILEAFKQIPEKKLIMIGNWEQNSYASDLFKQFNSFDNITLLPAMYDLQNEKNLLRACAKYYVHGHSVGGTSPALVESLCLGLTPICFDCIFNRKTTFDLGFYFKDSTELISVLINEKIANKDMIERARRTYSWANVSKLYLDILT